MKELWVQAEKENLKKLAADIADVVLEGKRAIVHENNQEIVIIEKLSDEALKAAKQQSRKTAVRVTIKGKEDENAAVKAAALGADYIIINCLDWRVIPLENLIAKTRGKAKLIAEVTTAQDAKLVLEALELGTDGVLITTSDAVEVRKTAEIVKGQAPKIAVATAKVVGVKPIGTGARACVDTCDLMTEGEGILVGSQSAGLFLVEAEVHENPYVAARPFRVNSGSISMYTLGSGENTRYLSELKAGDEVVVVNREGKTRKTNIGRVKIEFRPLILVEAEVEGKKIKVILQNAETIRLVTPEGSKPVTELKGGDEVLVHLAAKGGRHFGVSVTEEKVIER